MWIGVREVDSSYAVDSVEVLSVVIIIAQSDMKYLKKVNPEQQFYELSHGGMTDSSYYLHRGVLFQRLLFFWKTSFFKSLLPFITSVNYEHAYFVGEFLHILCLYFAFSNHVKNKKEVCSNSSCLQSVTWL